MICPRQVLRELGLVSEDEESMSDDPELLQRLCSILDVNSFELRPPGGVEDSPLRGLYPKTAIMAHDCVRNTHMTVDEKFELTVYASLPIKFDQPILVNYTSPLLVKTLSSIVVCARGSVWPSSLDEIERKQKPDSTRKLLDNVSGQNDPVLYTHRANLTRINFAPKM